MYVLALLGLILLPPVGLTTPCRVLEVYDGDTITVELRIPIRVRLLDCWAPEVKTKDVTEKQLGIKSREHLVSLAQGKEATMFIPFVGVERLDGVFTFGRVLAHVWVDGQSLSESQVEAGHATVRKTH